MLVRSPPHALPRYEASFIRLGPWGWKHLDLKLHAPVAMWQAALGLIDAGFRAPLPKWWLFRLRRDWIRLPAGGHWFRFLH